MHNGEYGDVIRNPLHTHSRSYTVSYNNAFLHSVLRERANLNYTKQNNFSWMGARAPMYEKLHRVFRREGSEALTHG